MVYRYARCSTNEKRQDIDRQKRELRAPGVTEDSHIYWEYESGAKDDRTEFQKLMNVVAPGDTIVTTEVSRLTRSTQFLCRILEIVQTKKLCLNIGGSFVVDCRSEEIDPMTKGMIMMWEVFAEMERDIISRRVRSGMENTAVKGKKIGRPSTSADSLPDKFWKYYKLYRDGALNISEFVKVMGCSRTTVYKYLSLAEK